MSPYRKKQRQKQRKKIFRKWHRRIGLASSLFFFNLAVTGILLNHYESLKLHQSYIESDFLLSWYGVKAPSEISCIKRQDFSLCQIGRHLYWTNNLNQIKQLNNDTTELINLYKRQSEYYLITSEQLYIYNTQFQLIDNINIMQEMSHTIIASAHSEQQLLLQTEKSFLLFDEDNFEFENISTEEIGDFKASPEKKSSLTIQSVTQMLKKSYQQQQITLLKFVQDLHSGQIFSLSGKIFTDITGIILILLAISGFITWQRRKNSSEA